MALLNEHYIFVKSEKLTQGVTVTERPVEKGLPITDNVKPNAKAISLSGELVGVGNSKAYDILSAITELHQKGKYVKYIGRNIMKNAIITAFDTDHANDIYGGCSFTMTIKEVRIAKSPLATKKEGKNNGGTQQVTNKSTKNDTVKKHTVKKGDTLWKLAKAYYGNGVKCNKIYKANKDIIKNPNKLKVGWVLKIPA